MRYGKRMTEALAISIPRTETAVIRHFQGAHALWAVRAGCGTKLIRVPEVL
jgi:hypothetical protein